MKLPESAINQFMNGAEEINDLDEEIVTNPIEHISDTETTDVDLESNDETPSDVIIGEDDEDEFSN